MLHRLILRLLLLLLFSVAVVSAYIWSNESDYIFFPDKQMAAVPSDYAIEYTPVRITTDDRRLLHGWYMRQPAPRFTLLHFHGNAGNIAHRISLYQRWMAMGLNVYAIDYRGYGKSEGAPDEAGLYLDAAAAWHDLTTKHGVDPKKIIIAGRSLGSAVAARLASQVDAAGVALEVPFTSIPDMAGEHYRWLPLRWLVTQRFDTESAVALINEPLLILGAKADAIAPVRMSRSLADLAQKTSSLSYQLLDGGHNDFDLQQAYLSHWLAWLNRLEESDLSNNEKGRAETRP